MGKIANINFVNEMAKSVGSGCSDEFLSKGLNLCDTFQGLLQEGNIINGSLHINNTETDYQNNQLVNEDDLSIETISYDSYIDIYYTPVSTTVPIQLFSETQKPILLEIDDISVDISDESLGWVTPESGNRYFGYIFEDTSHVYKVRQYYSHQKTDFTYGLINNSIEPYSSEWDDYTSPINSYVTAIDVSNLDVSNATSLYGLFFNCKKVEEIIGLETMNTSNVVNMGSTFRGCTVLENVEVSNWDVSKVTNMSWMFAWCRTLTTIDVSKWDTSSVETMRNAFETCPSLSYIDVSNFKLDKCRDLSWLFSVSYLLHWYYATNNLTEVDVSKWNVSNCTNICGMFGRCKKLKYVKGIENWDISNVTNISWLFTLCESLVEVDFGNWDTSNVTNMYNMFCWCSTLKKIDVSRWNTSKVTDMGNMFQDCSRLTELNLSNFNTSNVTNMSAMFQNASNIGTLDLSNFNTSNVTNMSGMFQNTKAKLDLSSFDTSNVTDMSHMFSGHKYESLNLNNFDVSKVTNMSWMFGQSSIKELDLSNWVTTNVENMESMFRQIYTMTQMNIKKWDMNNVTDYGNMFYDERGLTRIDMDESDDATRRKINGMRPNKVFVNGQVWVDPDA